MKTIPLYHSNKMALVSDRDYGNLSKFRWSMETRKSKNSVMYYPIRRVSRKRIYIHTLLFPNALIVDHRDRNGLNNQRRNLRPCHRFENNLNHGKYGNTTSRFKGVSWFAETRKWRAQISYNCVKIHLGYFQLEKDAARAYDSAARKYHGRFALTNAMLFGSTLSIAMKGTNEH